MAIPKPNLVFEVHESGAKQRGPWKWPRWSIAAMAIAVLLALSVWLLMPSRSHEYESGKVTTIEHGNLTLAISGYGKIIPANLVTLSTPSGGRVLSIVRHSGANVQPGDVILTLDNPDLVQRLREAQTNLSERRVELLKSQAEALTLRNAARTRLMDLRDALRVAELEATGLRALAEQKIVTPIELDKKLIEVSSINRKMTDAQTELAKLESIEHASSAGSETVLKTLEEDVARLQSEVSGLAVNSPEVATIFEMPNSIAVGAQLAPGATVASLALGKVLGAELQIPAINARDVVPGQSAIISINGNEYGAKVVRVDPQVVREEVTVTLELQALDQGKALVGQPITGKIVIQNLHNVLYAERPANVKPNSQAEVMVATHNSKSFEKRSVTFGPADSDHIVILAGAKRGELLELTRNR